MSATCVQGPPLSNGLVQPCIEEFNKSDSKTKGMPLEVKGLPLLLFSFTTPL